MRWVARRVLNQNQGCGNTRVWEPGTGEGATVYQASRLAGEVSGATRLEPEPGMRQHASVGAGDRRGCQSLPGE